MLHIVTPPDMIYSNTALLWLVKKLNKKKRFFNIFKKIQFLASTAVLRPMPYTILSIKLSGDTILQCHKEGYNRLSNLLRLTLD